MRIASIANPMVTSCRPMRSVNARAALSSPIGASADAVALAGSTSSSSVAGSCTATGATPAAPQPIATDVASIVEPSVG